MSKSASVLIISLSEQTIIFCPHPPLNFLYNPSIFFEEKKLLSVVDSIFASGYLTEGGQGIEDTLKTITDAGFTYEIESA